MSISTKFKEFTNNIQIESHVELTIINRRKKIVSRLNSDFWETTSNSNHCKYVGSYGRKTAIHVSDIDMLFQLPYSYYKRFNAHTGNGQSALLQEVRASLKKTYPKTYLKGDGQVLKIDFLDKMSFEIVPCFINNDGSFTFPDSNSGGSWKKTDPTPEIKELTQKNKDWNYNLKRLCRMVRAWKDQWDVSIGGLLIDTLCYNFMQNWVYKDKSYLYYDYMTRDFFEFLGNLKKQAYWLAPGSNQQVYSLNKFQYKAKKCYHIALSAIEYEESNYTYSANKKWREIYGTKFPL